MRLPFLKRVERAVHRRLFARSVVLMYHRIADPESDPWRLCVSPKNFAAQLDMLRRADIDVVSLGELPDRVANHAGRRSVVITFDDGYRDNLVNGDPALAERDLPATLFVTSSYLTSDVPFWWDELTKITLSPGMLPDRLDLSTSDGLHSWSLGDAAAYSEEEAAIHQSWKASAPPPTRRHQLMIELWQLLVGTPDEERESIIADLVEWAGTANGADDLSSPMSKADIAALADSGRWTIGAHGHTHGSFPALPDERIAFEMATSRKILQDVSGQDVDTLSYPQGMLEPKVAAAAGKAGFRLGFTSRGEAVTKRFNHLAIPRVGVPDVGGEELAGRLAYYMAFEH